MVISKETRAELERLKKTIKTAINEAQKREVLNERMKWRAESIYYAGKGDGLNDAWKEIDEILNPGDCEEGIKKMESCVVACFRLPSEEQERFGVFSSLGKAIRALRGQEADSVLLTTIDMDRIYEKGEPYSVLYMKPNKGDCEEEIDVEELSKRMGIKYID